VKIDKKVALLYGIMLGDGCLCEHRNKKKSVIYFISISGNYYDDKPFYSSIVIPLINSLRKNKSPIKFGERKTYGKIEINFSDRDLFSQLKSIGFPVGKKGNKLKIPSIFYNKNLMRYILQGFFSTDGSLVLTKNPNKFYPRMEGAGISKNLISQIWSYLNKVGMKGSFYEVKRIKVDWEYGNHQQQYRFQFNGKENLLLFNEKIGFVNPKQKEKFLNFLRYSEEYDNQIKGIQTQKQKLFRDKIKL